jgi:hypothetical protein
VLAKPNRRLNQILQLLDFGLFGNRINFTGQLYSTVCTNTYRTGTEIQSVIQHQNIKCIIINESGGNLEKTACCITLFTKGTSALIEVDPRKTVNYEESTLLRLCIMLFGCGDVFQGLDSV